MPGVGVITNPRSRVNRRDPTVASRLAWLIGSRGAAAATTSIDDLYRAAEEFKKADVDVLGINGGDGTIHHTLTAFVKTYADQPLPAIAILRGGTMNTIANSLGLRGRPPKLLFELVDKHHTGTLVTREQRLLEIRDSERTHYGFIFGNGLLYNFLDAYYSSGKPSPWEAVKLLARACVSALIGGSLARDLNRRLKARVTVDGDTWAREDFMTVAASTVEQIGLGFKPFYRVKERPDAFPILGIHCASPFELAGQLPRIFRGRPMRRDKVIDMVGAHLSFEADELPYIIDGDTYRATGHLDVRLGPLLRLVELTGRATQDFDETTARLPEPA